MNKLLFFFALFIVGTFAPYKLFQIVKILKLSTAKKWTTFYAKYSRLFVGIICFAPEDAADISVESLCLKQQGLQHPLVQYFDEIEKPNSDILTPEVEDKLACTFACIYENNKPHTASLHDLLTGVFNRIDLDVTGDKREELLDIANNCHIRAGEDLCKYLQCIKLMKQPMVGIIFENNLRRHKNKQ